jgi:O-antigen ligase
MALITAITVLALLANYHVVELPGVEFCDQSIIDPTTGQATVIPRLQSTGIFNDPNDFAMILVAGVVIALSFAADPAAGILRPLALPLVGLFGYAIYATQSRGGLLALMAALVSLFHARWGWKRTALLAAVALPLLLVAFKGRLTNYDDALGQGTAQTRVQLWSEGLAAFRQHPVFGIGVGNYEEAAGQVAHNSFVHAFTEMGFFGGTLFLGAFVAGLMTLYRLRGRDALAEQSELHRLLPYITAMLVGFAVSMYSLSRNYVVPTYMMLGLVTAYGRIVADQTESLPLEFDSWLVKRLAVGSVCFLVAMYVFIRVAVHF